MRKGAMVTPKEIHRSDIKSMAVKKDIIEFSTFPQRI